MGRKKEEPKTEDTGPFPRNAVTPVEETEDQKERRTIEEAITKGDAAYDRKENTRAHHTFDAKTKQHVQSILQSVIDGKARFRSRSRSMTRADGDAIVRRACSTLNDGMDTRAKALVQVAADTLIRETNDNYAELAEFARMASIDIASQYVIDPVEDEDKTSVVDVVASIPRG